MADTRKNHGKQNNAIRTAEALLGQVRQLRDELHPQQSHQLITLDSTLDRELGLDSLARIELLLRVERCFDVRLPDQLVMSVETPRDLLKAALGAETPVPENEKPVTGMLADEARGEPAQAATLVEVLDWHAAKHPARTHIMLYGQKGQKEIITYQDLLNQAEGVCAGLRHLDLQPGQAVAIMLPTGREFFAGFYGILLAGAVPVPVYPPVRLRQIEEHMRRQAGILTNAQARMLITFEEIKPLARLLKSRIESLQSVVTVEELSAAQAGRERPVPQAQDTALLQYTSGSTGNPKGVVLTHANLLANIRAMGQAAKVDSTDVFVSWLPLYHDMGLIGACMG
ncbi:MAG: AMP-binding protein, partial [Mariprofundaceae bacterium]